MGVISKSAIALLAATSLAAPAPGANPPNVLMILADDFGATEMARFGIGTDPALTPSIDRLADRGILFTNAWSNPVCSSTRACIQTGRHSFRTGIGFIVLPTSQALDPAESTLPEVLGGYASGAFGKWHLGNASVGGALAPNVAGFGQYSGSLHSLIDNNEVYSYYLKTVNGVGMTSSTYNTTEIVDDAVRWLRTAPEPWFCYVAFNAPHVPLHAPPAQLHSIDLGSAPPPTSTPRPYYKAMVEAMDTEIGRLVGSLGHQTANTNIIFAGDNGSPAEVAIPPVLPEQAKISLYEPGIQVPLIIAGPAVRGKSVESEALVHLVDLFPTVADMAQVDLGTVLPSGTDIDGQSLVPYLQNANLPSQREYNYSEIFGNLPSGEFTAFAIRDHRYKYVQTRASVLPPNEQLYDLWNDPNEYTDLLGQVGDPQVLLIRDRLVRAADAIRKP